MKKAVIKCIDRMVKNALKTNVNSTTSIAAYQPILSQKIKNEFMSNSKK